MKHRILLADDHGVLRAGLRMLINAEPNLEVVAEAADGEEALALIIKLQPELAILDISMPGLNGLEVVEKLSGVENQTRVLILTVHEDTFLLRKALKLGAAGYILKQAVETELIDAVRAALKGDVYIHPVLTRELVKGLTSKKTPAEQSEKLTQRELEVLYLIVQGFTSRDIANELNISARTVETHRANIMQKLNLRTRVELVRYAKLHHIIE